MVKLKSNEAWDLEVEWEKFVVKVEWAGGGEGCDAPLSLFSFGGFSFF